jgi:hypothetical protein
MVVPGKEPQASRVGGQMSNFGHPCVMKARADELKAGLIANAESAARNEHAAL